ncbi:BatA domain-containing protein, partial [Oricola nitratireducens]|uniref:BatA domain-containing protein n=1 Tax=Oricola nitratireducens TaxID=2775868 RepID=UPI001867B4E9
MLGLPVTFAAPAILFGLLALPVIWWLLRLTPPKPQTEVFPPLRLLARVMKHEETPARSPWWLTLLRLLMTALVILALARPILNPVADVATGDGPVALLIDNDWSTGADWDKRIAEATQLVRDAANAGRPVAVAYTVAPDNANVALANANDVLPSLAAAQPLAAKPDRVAAIGRLSKALEGAAPATLAWMSDGMRNGADDGAVDAINAMKLGEVLLFDSGIGTLRAIRGIDNAPTSFDVHVVAPDGLATGADPVSVSAYDEKGRLLAETDALFEAGKSDTVARFDVPFELRNDFATLRIAGQQQAGSVWLVDENTRRRRIGLVTGQAGDLAQPLLSPLYYIQRALQPFADLVEGRTGDLAVDVPALVAQGPAMIVMADIGVLPEAASRALSQWIENGGTLVRFAGPRLASTAGDDPLLPVKLRLGERTLGGSLSWTEPQAVAAFPGNGPFGGLAAPQDVTVNRQVLAEPDLDLASRTWANLADGTPLVTGAARGKGSIVLFHVTAEATWSNLPISGSFVEMLRRIANLSRNTGTLQTGNSGVAGEALPPYRILAANG